MASVGAFAESADGAGGVGGERNHGGGSVTSVGSVQQARGQPSPSGNSCGETIRMWPWPVGMSTNFGPAADKAAVEGSPE